MSTPQDQILVLHHFWQVPKSKLECGKGLLK